MTSDIQLETLESKGLIKLATVRPELEYLFRHALVQDAAYGSLLKQERRALHGQVGEALEELYPERTGELAPVLGMHFEQAGQSEKAIEYYVAGATHANRQFAIQEAFGAFARAAALADEQGTEGDQSEASEAELARRRRRRVQIELGRAEAGYSFRAPEETFGALERVIAEADRLGDPELIVRVQTMIAMGRLMHGDTVETPEVKRALDRIAEIGEAIGDPSMRVMPMAVIGLSQVFAGPVRDGVTALETALPQLEGHWDSIGAAFARGALAIGYASLGEFDKAEAAARRASEIAGDGDLIAQLDAQIAEGYVKSLKGELDAAQTIALDCLERSEKTGASACMVVSSWILGDAFHRQGRYAEARDVLQRGTDISMVVDRRVWRPTLQAWLGSATVALGDPDSSDWDGALTMARSIGNKSGEAQILWKMGQVAAVRGDLDAALPSFSAAAALMEEMGVRPYLARALRDWGEALQSGGRGAEAKPILERALHLFEEMGLEREAGITRTSLSLGGAKLAFD